MCIMDFLDDFLDLKTSKLFFSASLLLFIHTYISFQILASLFVLSVVAEPEAEPQHHTAGFTAYTNGALVPEVKTISDQHFF